MQLTSSGAGKTWLQLLLDGEGETWSPWSGGPAGQCSCREPVECESEEGLDTGWTYREVMCDLSMWLKECECCSCSCCLVDKRRYDEEVMKNAVHLVGSPRVGSPGQARRQLFAETPHCAHCSTLCHKNPKVVGSNKRLKRGLTRHCLCPAPHVAAFYVTGNRTQHGVAVNHHHPSQTLVLHPFHHQQQQHFTRSCTSR